MKKIMLLLALSAMVVVLFAPMATARQHRDDVTTMTATASATASATATASGTAAGGGGGGGKKGDRLPKTGGPAPMALLSGVILAGSGVVAWSYLRRREVS